jgi:hypothetical protein
MLLFCNFIPGSSAVLIHICMFLQQGRDVVNYIQNELEALEREQKQIDKQAALLEKDLRRVMESGTGLTGHLTVCIVGGHQNAYLLKFTFEWLALLSAHFRWFSFKP